jgi:hypothetical protein
MKAEVDFAQINKELEAFFSDGAVPASDRADALIFKANELGLDVRPVIRRILEQADAGRELKAKLGSSDANPLASERFIGTLERRGHYAAVTRGPNTIYLPVEPQDEEVAQLRQGDPVLIDVKQERIVGRDGQFPTPGDVAVIESLPADHPGQVVVKHNDRAQLAWLHHALQDAPQLCQPGTRVSYDANRRFVLAPVDTDTDGSELLTSPSKLGRVQDSEIGAPKPVADEILQRVTLAVDHPDWVDDMRARKRCSYLFVGGTGTGKSYTLRYLTGRVHDRVEAMTGQRSSRVVICDASQFWHPLFGETEARISAWAAKLEKLGKLALRSRDGSELHFPLLVVLEECEALLRVRGDQSGSGHLFDRPLALILQKTESLEATLQVPIIWVATTNRADLADPAALRRLGMRRVVFGNLCIDEAYRVLETKVPDDMPIRGSGRDALLRSVLGYLYGPEPKQGLADVRMASSETRVLNRCDLVTPAVLEEAISWGIDAALRASLSAGELQGLDAADVVGFLDRHYHALARTLTRFNLPAHCPEWFEHSAQEIATVTPLGRPVRRTVPVLR